MEVDQLPGMLAGWLRTQKRCKRLFGVDACVNEEILIANAPDDDI
jgi:hypothetical protein